MTPVLADDFDGASAGRRPPKVTVAIPAYNRERYLADAIESVLAQTFTDFELLIVDDGSSDRSVEIARSYRDPRVRIVRHDRNKGVAAARNTAVAEAAGAYFAFLDSDDVAYPDRLARQVAFLDRHPDHAAVGAWIDWMDEHGRRTRRVKRKPVSWDEIAAQRLFRAGLENTVSMARTAILRRYGHDERYSLGSDFDLWARIAADHKLANLPRVLACRRLHPAQTTRERAAQIREHRLDIFASQLDALGISHTREDLARHFLLRRMHKESFRPDRAYLDWAEGWLSKLQTANAQAGFCPEPAFSRVLGGFWLKACRCAASEEGSRAWRRFFASPLRAGAWAGAWKEATLRLPRPFASTRPMPATATAPRISGAGSTGEGAAR